MGNQIGESFMIFQQYLDQYMNQSNNHQENKYFNQDLTNQNLTQQNIQEDQQQTVQYYQSSQNEKQNQKNDKQQYLIPQKQNTYQNDKNLIDLKYMENKKKTDKSMIQFFESQYQRMREQKQYQDELNSSNCFEQVIEEIHSDSESEDEDLNETQINKLHEEIISNQQLINSIFKQESQQRPKKKKKEINQVFLNNSPNPNSQKFKKPKKIIYGFGSTMIQQSPEKKLFLKTPTLSQQSIQKSPFNKIETLEKNKSNFQQLGYNVTNHEQISLTSRSFYNRKSMQDLKKSNDDQQDNIQHLYLKCNTIQTKTSPKQNSLQNIKMIKNDQQQTFKRYNYQQLHEKFQDFNDQFLLQKFLNEENDLIEFKNIFKLPPIQQQVGQQYQDNRMISKDYLRQLNSNFDISQKKEQKNFIQEYKLAQKHTQEQHIRPQNQIIIKSKFHKPSKDQILKQTQAQQSNIMIEDQKIEIKKMNKSNSMQIISKQIPIKQETQYTRLRNSSTDDYKESLAIQKKIRITQNRNNKEVESFKKKLFNTYGVGSILQTLNEQQQEKEKCLNIIKQYQQIKFFNHQIAKQNNEHNDPYPSQNQNKYQQLMKTNFIKKK